MTSHLSRACDARDRRSCRITNGPQAVIHLPRVIIGRVRVRSDGGWGPYLACEPVIHLSNQGVITVGDEPLRGGIRCGHFTEVFEIRSADSTVRLDVGHELALGIDDTSVAHEGRPRVAKRITSAEFLDRASRMAVGTNDFRDDSTRVDTETSSSSAGARGARVGDRARKGLAALATAADAWSLSGAPCVA